MLSLKYNFVLFFICRYLNLLENEVYVTNSPIWDSKFKELDLKNYILNGINFLYTVYYSRLL